MIRPITPVGRSELWDRAVRLIHHTTEMILRSLQQYPTDNACGTVRAVGQSCETHTSHYSNIRPITPVGRSELWDRAVRLIHHTTEMIRPITPVGRSELWDRAVGRSELWSELWDGQSCGTV